VRARLVIVSLLLSTILWTARAQDGRQGAAAAAALPNAAGSLKIAVLGDFGTGSSRQYELAAQMVKAHGAFPFELVLLVGDNLYGSERPQDFQKKFEIPYKALLDAGVKFYASLGNHDAREQRYYKPFNMDGKLYYSFKAPRQDVRFIALESTYPEPTQIAWLENELKSAKEAWKVVFFHHPLYSSGERHGSDTRLRDTLEPLFLKYGVSLVFTGHDHFYERVKPQKGILYFVTGSGGQLRKGNIDTSTGLTAAGLDTDNAFLMGEFVGDTFSFRAIARSGQVVDSGSFHRRTE
jgi:3',5'-cyclic AMP phosphodiesterase CpdA